MKLHKEFEPKIVAVFREGYSRAQLLADIGAGFITGIIALPLAIAFAIASGVAPEQGLYTAIIAGFLISLLGGSRCQIGGPTGAFVVIVYNIVHHHGMAGLTVATIMAGILLIAMGLLRLGSVIKFIPWPVTLGFTSGIALIIAVSQIRDFLGLQMTEVPAEFLPKMAAIASSLGTVNAYTVLLALASLAVLILWPRTGLKVPGSIVVVVAATLIVRAFHLPVETIGARFGEIPAGLPKFTPPDFAWSDIKNLMPAALTIAMLGAIESLLSAVVADGMLGTRHRSNVELVAQGVANVVTPFFGGIPATGAIARTSANIKSGGRTPVAGMIHAVVLLGILLGLGRAASMIPLAALAAILIHVAFKMSELPLLAKMLRAPKSDILIMAMTFLLTVLIDLTVAIPVGIVLAAFLFMRRMEEVAHVGRLDSSEQRDELPDDPLALDRLNVPPGVEVFEINGPFFFGVASRFQDTLESHRSDVLVLRMRNVPAIDATGVFALEKVLRQSRRRGRHVLLSGVRRQPMRALQRGGLVDLLGADHIHKNIASALDHAARLVHRAEDAGVVAQPAAGEGDGARQWPAPQ